MIDLGYVCIENTREYNEYVFIAVLRVSAGMLSNGREVGDNHTAFAIRTGLIEMSLDILENYVKHYPSSTVSIFDYMQHIFYRIYIVSLHQKTWKAISHKRRSVEEKLVRLEEITNITSNAEHKKLLDMARSIIDISGSYCCRCNKSLTRTEVMECNGCGCMTYCSRACQREDWFSGHNVTCNKPYNPESSGQFQGRYMPEEVPSDQRAAEKVVAIEKNLTMVQLKLFLDNSDKILAQAKELNLPLYDCVVCFDLRTCPLRGCPPIIGVHDYRDEFDNLEERKGFEETRSKDNIMCDYYSHVFNGEYKEDGVVCMQRLFPHEWLTNGENEWYAARGWGLISLIFN